MTKPLFLRIALFDHASRHTFRGTRDTNSRYGHTFGTNVVYKGLRPFQGKPPVHVLLRLNMLDPAVAVPSAKVGWLPLLCAIRYDARDLGYRVKSDTEVEILHQDETKPQRRCFAGKLEVRAMSYRKMPLKPDRPLDVIKTLGVFGCHGLTKRRVSDLIRFVDPDGTFDPNATPYRTVRELLCKGFARPLIQGRPEDDCPDKQCSNHKKKGAMRVFSIFEEDSWEANRRLWGEFGGWPQIIHQFCPICGAIRVRCQDT